MRPGHQGWACLARVKVCVPVPVQRMGAHLRPTGEKLERLRGIVRAEIEGEIQRERETLERWLGAGLILLVLGAGQTVFALRQ